MSYLAGRREHAQGGALGCIDATEPGVCRVLGRVALGVTLNDHDATATARVDATGEYLGKSFTGLFVGIANEWRGWDEAKTWESIEHTLRLSARHDGLGHVLREH